MFFKVLCTLCFTLALWALIAMYWFPMVAFMVVIASTLLGLAAYGELVLREQRHYRILVLKRADFKVK